MKKYSVWAKRNKKAARLTIVLSFVALTCLGILTGRLLEGSGVSLSASWLWLALVVYFVALIAYPFRKKPGSYRVAYQYARQKTCDVLLAGSTFLLLICVSNKPSVLFSNHGTLYAAVSIQPVQKDSSGKKYQSLRMFSKTMKDADGKQLKWKERKKLLKQQVKAIRKSADSSAAGKALLIVLSVLIALGLIALIAALACEISCAGSEAAAMVIFIGGTGLVILLLVLAIRAILGKKKKKESVPGT